ncbi:Phosphatidylethanolamine-binding protein 1 [Tyrophagus putrescentiae]|nr:Phosphatidylethanolamine-binding protein 1 [Tyrophagus putrescentiae]
MSSGSNVLLLFAIFASVFLLFSELAHCEDLVIEYGNVAVHQGTELTPKQTHLPPTVLSWPTEPETLYTLLVTDADVPAKVREINHWTIVNIAGTNVATGETLEQYTGANPPQGSGTHRYVFRVYKQSEKNHMKRFTTRTSFNSTRFILENHLEGPLAENFFVSQYQPEN